jgi:hypothetical protein
MKARRLIFAMSALASAAALLPIGAGAANRHGNAVDCVNPGSTSIAYDSGNGQINGPGEVYCTFPDRDAMSQNSLTNLNLHGRDDNGSAAVQVFACVSYWNSTGGACGSAASSSDGQYGISPSRTQWSGSGHFAYLKVNLPSSTSYYGYWAAN